MSETEGPARDHRGGAESEEVLRAKYLDYCSAQVADTLLLLSPDDIYVLARRAAGEKGIESDLGYDEVVRLATDRLAERLVLPPFELWVEDYRAHPELYEEYLLGLWESDSEDEPREG